MLETMEKTGSLPIDSFLRSLAQDQGRNKGAVILSGTGTDGTLGVKEIKAHHGLVLVQSEESSAYNGMPKSSLATGLVDIAARPEEMRKAGPVFQARPAGPGFRDAPPGKRSIPWPWFCENAWEINTSR